jgi:small subunit ribosomal protein S16
MAVRLRLRRVGARRDPVWRVVVADQRSPRDGRVIETLGHYNPQTAPSTVVLDQERAQRWLARGAQPTPAVSRLLRIHAASAASGEGPASGDRPEVGTTEARTGDQPGAPEAQADQAGAPEAAAEQADAGDAGASAAGAGETGVGGAGAGEAGAGEAPAADAGE